MAVRAYNPKFCGVLRSQGCRLGSLRFERRDQAGRRSAVSRARLGSPEQIVGREPVCWLTDRWMGGGESGALVNMIAEKNGLAAVG